MLVKSVLVCGLICPLLLGAVGGVGPALLGLAAAMLLASVGLLWASARELTGPGRSSGLDDDAAPLDATSDRKRRALRALRDLEFERSVGKLEDDDFARLSSHYRAIAKDVLRDMDAATEPELERAEALITSYLASLPPSFWPNGKAPAHLGSSTNQTASAEAPLHACAECGTTTRAASPICDDCRARRQAEDRSGGTPS